MGKINRSKNMSNAISIALAANCVCEGRSRKAVIQQYGVTSQELDSYFAYWSSEEGLDQQQASSERNI